MTMSWMTIDSVSRQDGASALFECRTDAMLGRDGLEIAVVEYRVSWVEDGMSVVARSHQLPALVKLVVAALGTKIECAGEPS